MAPKYRFFLAQLDHSFDSSYGHLASALRRHTQSDRVTKPKPHEIETGAAWYYKYFYPKSGSAVGLQPPGV
jgi:hypothetical protein